MSNVQSGAWKSSDGVFKVFIRGCEQENGSVVEVISRFGKVDYVVITDIHCKASGGFLYDFKFTGKPNELQQPLSSIGPENSTRVVAPEVSVEELDEALGFI